MENSRLSFDEDIEVRTVGDDALPVAEQTLGVTNSGAERPHLRGPITDDVLPEEEHTYLHDWTPEPNSVAAKSAPGPAIEPYVDPLEPVRQLERTHGLPRKALLGGAFSKIPLPTAQSNSAQLVDYWKKANRAGVPVTANDLETYVDLLGDLSGRSVLIDNRNGRGLSPGLQKMGQVFAQQNPAEVKRTMDGHAVALMGLRDTHEELFPQLCADTDPARVAADSRRFAQNLTKVAQLAPLPKDASPQMLADYRDAARAVGVRLKIEHIEEHRFDGRVTYRRPGQPVPLGLTVLKELDKPVGERHLFNENAESWAKILRERQPMPVPPRAVDETLSRDSVRDQPEEPAYGKSPQTLAEAPRREQPASFVPARGGAFGSPNTANATGLAELTELATHPSIGARPVTAPSQRFQPTQEKLARKGPAPAPPHH